MLDIWSLLAMLVIWAMVFYTVTRTAIAITEAIQAHAPSRHLRLQEKYRALSQVFDFTPKDTADALVLGKFEYHRRWLELHTGAPVSQATPSAPDVSQQGACGLGVCALRQGHVGGCRQ